MIEATRIYTTSEVAAALQHTVQWFRAHRRRLEGEGFPPPPVSRIGHPRWCGADLLAWITRPKPVIPAQAGTQSNDPPPAVPGNITDIRALLRARARAIAREGRKESR